MKNKTESPTGPKDITCAVRFNHAMYQRLKDVAKDEGLSLSDIIRQALTKFMDEHSKTMLEKKLEEIELKKKVTEATKGEDASLREVLLELLAKSA